MNNYIPCTDLSGVVDMLPPSPPGSLLLCSVAVCPKFRPDWRRNSDLVGTFIVAQLSWLCEGPLQLQFFYTKLTKMTGRPLARTLVNMELVKLLGSPVL